MKRAQCVWCGQWQGALCRVFASYEAFQGSSFYGGGDRVVGDSRGARFAVWPGKNNAERSWGDWWCCVPVHPFCSHHWEAWEPGAAEDSRFDTEDREALEGVRASFKSAIFQRGVWREATCAYDDSESWVLRYLREK